MPVPTSRSPKSAGILLAILPIAGAILGGAIWRQPVIGLLTGIALAVVLVLGFWLADRAR